MYVISLSYMMYLPVAHSIPLTIILRSAFCVLHSAICKIPLPTSYCRDSYSLILVGRTPSHLLRFFCYLRSKFGDFRDKQEQVRTVL